MENPLLTVAIVDDSTFMRESARLRLSILGYKVVMEAENGQEFLDKLAQSDIPDICLLDLNMPVMDGFETARNLKKNWPAIRILFHSMERIGEGAYACFGADGFVAKDASALDFRKALLSIAGHQPVA
ncbi:response regulator [Pseudoflavitalea sp. X16]|uniref:response regulator n=1 Tax=Paraflavitalea devenefica TaxID=2716334 RepID=UPI0014230691|nr:response regulator transcription factor [Paraflavitalea devenefica]NII29256.1 response regulator [Paraflavitalea devenefica]